jgi:hypothetical protein
MAAGTFSVSPKMKRSQLVDLTKIAVDDWFVDSGMIDKKGEIKLSRTLKSYGLKTPHINKLSLHVIGFVEHKTGVDFKLRAGELSQFGDASINAYIKGSVGRFIAALPGDPSTLPTRRKKREPLAEAALPGEPVTLPGKPVTTPSKPSGKR